MTKNGKVVSKRERRKIVIELKTITLVTRVHCLDVNE